ncbi:MAG: glycosyltransferase family 87 protein [Acidobacteriaceae bacterium]
MVVLSYVQLREVGRIIPASWSDLYPQWAASKAALHGENPYSDAVTQEIQRGFYGRVLVPGDTFDLQNFVYPAHLIFLLAPFTGLPWTVVRILFTVLAPPVIAATVWAWFEVLGLRLDRTHKMAAIGLTLVCWPAFWSYQQQQPSVYVIAMLAFALLLFRRGWDLGAGLLLAFATVKPTLVAPLVLWLLLVGVAQRRWRFVGATLVCTSVLLIGAEFLVPGWIGTWINISRVYSQDPRKTILLVKVFGQTLGIAATLAMLGVMGLRLWKTRYARPQDSDFGQAISMILAATLCIIPTTKWMIYNDLLLVPAILLLTIAGPVRSYAKPLVALAILAFCISYVVTPVCAAASLAVGYAPFLAVVPFFANFSLPIAVLAATLTLRGGPIATFSQNPATPN